MAPTSDPQEEWLDVVDERNEVIARATYADCHRQGLRHRAVHVEVWNPKRTHLLVYNRSANSRFFRGLIDIAAGHVLAGETPEVAARRELIEKYGLAPGEFEEVETFLDEWQLPGVLNRTFIAVYRCYWRGDCAFLARVAVDGSDWRWMAREPLLEQLEREPHVFAPAISQLLRRHQEGKLPT